MPAIKIINPSYEIMIIARDNNKDLHIFDVVSRFSAPRFDRDTQLGKPCVKSIVVQFVRYGVKHGKSGQPRFDRTSICT